MGNGPVIESMVHRAAPRHTAQTAATTTKPDPEVLGFAQSGEVVSGAWQGDLHMDLLSTIAYFGIDTNDDGSLYTNDSGYQGYFSSQAGSLISTAHASGVRVVVVVKSFDSPTVQVVLGNEQNRQHLIASIIWLISTRGVDGVNIDFEANAQSSLFTTFCQELKAALNAQLPQQNYLSVDTYASAAEGGELWNVPALRPYIDAFMVMAYDMFPSNGTAGPNAALTGYNWNDTRAMNDFLSVVPSSQVILGVPYYGYKWNVSNAGPNAPTTSGLTADTYSGALSDMGCGQSLTRGWDSTGQVPWASWWSPGSGDPCGANRNSYRELYYDNAQSLGLKYDLVNNDHLRGIGIWALGYDSGSNDLWTEIGAKFSVTKAPTVTVTALPATETTAAFTLQWQLTPGSVAASQYNIYSQDPVNGSWLLWGTTTALSTPFYGFPCKTYAFYVQPIAAAGWSEPPPSAGSAQASTTVSCSATSQYGFVGMYAVDNHGQLHPGSSPPLPISAAWPNWDIVRGMAAAPGGEGGVVLDGWGGLHQFGSSPGPTYTSGYWTGWDIARGAVETPGGTGGYVLDGWGGVHPFALGGNAPPAPVTTSAYWTGWDIARGVAAFSDGSGGLVLDGWG